MPNNKRTIPRLMQLISMLKAEEYPNHPRLEEAMRHRDIAGAYSITQKTIQRDVAFLKEEFNAPIAYDSSKRGYYLTDPKWEITLPGLSDGKLKTALLAARIAEKLMPDPMEKEIGEVLLAIQQAHRRAEVSSRTLLSLVATGSKVPIVPEIFQTVFDAWEKRTVIRIDYLRAQDGQMLDLTFEPHVLVFFDSIWYLKGVVRKCDRATGSTENDVVTLAVHRIRSIEPLQESFLRDEKLVEACNRGEVFHFPQARNITLRLRGKGAVYGPEMFPGTLEPPEDDDSRLLHVPEAEEWRLLRFTADWPGEVEIVSPPELRRKAADAGTELLRLHRI